MKNRTIGFGLVTVFAAAAAALMFSSAPADAAEGADLTIHNSTGTDVDIVVWDGDDHAHKTPNGGAGTKMSVGHFPNGGVGKLHVKYCKFAITLFHGNDAYHSEFHDCKVTDINISAANK